VRETPSQALVVKRQAIFTQTGVPAGPLVSVQNQSAAMGRMLVRTSCVIVTHRSPASALVSWLGSEIMRLGLAGSLAARGTSEICRRANSRPSSARRCRAPF